MVKWLIKKELYEVLFEELNHKMDIVLESFREVYRKFEEDRAEEKRMYEELAHKFQMVINDLKKNKIDAFVKSPRRVILRSGATKNLNNIRFFAIAQNDKKVFL